MQKRTSLFICPDIKQGEIIIASTPDEEPSVNIKLFFAPKISAKSFCAPEITPVGHIRLSE